MSNVLDLKNGPPTQTAEVLREQESSTGALTDEEARLISEDAFSAEGPTKVAWEGHHPLSGSARWRHWMFLAIIVASGAFVSLWQDSLVPFFVMLFGAAALEARERWGKPISVAIDERGVAVDGTRYDHAAFASFHIHRMPDDTFELSLRSDKRFLPHFRIPLGDQDPHEVHAVLSNYVVEGEHRIPLVDYLIRKP